MESPIWKDVIGYEDLFKVSNEGQVFSKRTNKILKQQLNPHGYYEISTRIGGRKGKAICFKVHRLVAEAFLSQKNKLLEGADKNFYGVIPVNHKNGDKKDNRLCNLEFCSYAENTRHAFDKGMIPDRRKYSKQDILDIIVQWIHSEKSLREYCKSINMERKVLTSNMKFYFNILHGTRITKDRVINLIMKENLN